MHTHSRSPPPLPSQGNQLEPRMGSLPFLALVAELGLLSNLLYVGAAAALSTLSPAPSPPRSLLARLLAPLVGGGRGWGGGGDGMLGMLRQALSLLLDPRGPMRSCAVGFSGVLFGLKAVLGHGAGGWGSVHGMPLPMRYMSWAELLLAQMLVPGVCVCVCV
jgi:hypothetical protein